jgi:hypothetical protein
MIGENNSRTIPDVATKNSILQRTSAQLKVTRVYMEEKEDVI